MYIVISPGLVGHYQECREKLSLYAVVQHLTCTYIGINRTRFNEKSPTSFLDTQGLHRLEKNLNIESFLEKSLKTKSFLKSTGESL